MNREAFKQALRVLDALSDAQFHIDSWMLGVVDLPHVIRNDCNTVGCIAGWCARDPWFNSVGFVAGVGGVPVARDQDGGQDAFAMNAVRTFFGLGHNACAAIFMPEGYRGTQSATRVQAMEKIDQLLADGVVWHAADGCDYAYDA